MKENEKPIFHVIGAGLAGSEACFYLLKKGYEVHLYERRPAYDDKAHHTALFGELVCSNSLKSKLLSNASGLQKEEMRKMGSITMEAASKTEVPAGNALSVDRDGFASEITAILNSFSNLHVHFEEITEFPKGNVILATGPLTDGKLMDAITGIVGKGAFSFFDASAPIVKKESIDFNKAYYKSRFSQGDEAYINCPFTKEEYLAFHHELVNAKKALLHDFDTHYFEGCLPVEVIASRGAETLRHGPLKPFGLSDETHHPYAALQLRQDTALGDCYNLVGFQTNLTYPEQKRVFSMIPGLENAEFVRYGLMHRNSYLDSPRCLNPDLSFQKLPNVFVAGQLSGVEGYTESAACGIIAAINAERKALGLPFIEVPTTTVTGALLRYILTAPEKSFSPMNANWALFPNVDKKQREEYASFALFEIESYYKRVNE